MKNYCCCAIPVLNVGIYFTIFEQFVVGAVVGTLAFATPRFVSATTPAFAPYIVMGIAYGFAGIQLLGFLGVFKEKATLFRYYTLLNYAVLGAGLAATATFIIICATGHNAAASTCLKTFFTDASADQGKILCEIFTWVGVGVMGGLWILFAIVQGYLALVVRAYGHTQREDHNKYRSIYSVNNGMNDNDILLNERSRATPPDAWDARPSTDSWRDPTHGRSYSDLQPVVPQEKYPTDPAYGYNAPAADPYAAGVGDYKHPRSDSTNTTTTSGQAGRGAYREPSIDNAYLQHPDASVTQTPGPTPYAQNYYASSTTAPSYYTHDPIPAQPQAQYHPAEGSFGRKTPRYGPR